jgi:glycosyltransferase involved in cell wall biosynthesis
VVSGLERFRPRNLIKRTLQFLGRQRRSAHRQLLLSSGLFDPEWYLAQNPDVRRTEIDPAIHYLRHGGAEGRDPSPIFDTDWYYWRNPEVRQARANPVMHFLRTRRACYWHWDTSAARAAKVKGQSRCSSLLNIVFVNHGSFNNNSAGHIAGIANALADRGHNVIVCAKGNPQPIIEFSVPNFTMLSRGAVMGNPSLLSEVFANTFDEVPTLLHCWTARENVRTAAEAIIEKLNIPYFVHLEDNDDFIKRAELGLTGASAQHLQGHPSFGPSSLRARSFVSEAAGISIIVDALRQLVPAHIPVHALQPGLDRALFASSQLDRSDRRRICHMFNAPPDACIIPYTGNVHFANAQDMLQFYEAVQLLNRRGLNVHLVRTGSNHCPELDERFKELSQKHVTDLGLVDRLTLVQVFRLGDIFVQPGAPGEFNDYRLPSKLPDFLASGRPVILPATNVGLHLRDGVDCLLLHRGDAMEIADRVAALVRDKELAARLASNARQFAIRNFDWAISAAHLEEFYLATLNSARASRIGNNNTLVKREERSGLAQEQYPPTRLFSV